jgi:CheY-like chemotaxis protein
MAAAQRIRVTVESGVGRPAVAADRTRLTQILMNFGSNAIKYNRPAGTVTFTVSSPRSEAVRLTVRDTGMGIPVDKQDKLFQPFQRAGQEAGPIEGTGIGLVVSKRLAQMMGGSVGFRSNPGEGSEFWLELPLQESGVRASASNILRNAEVSRNVGPTRRLVLSIEDNPANITFMHELITTFDDVDLLTAFSAETGVEIARARRPDVIIMDINLPGMSGLDALLALRGAPETRGIPVIALTAAATERDVRRGLAAGFDGYLTKPVKVEQFLSVLRALLDAADQDANAAL